MNKFTFWDFLKKTLFFKWLSIEDAFTFDPPLWTMPYELWGSFFSFFLAIIVIKINWPYIFFFFTIAIVSFFLHGQQVGLLVWMH